MVNVINHQGSDHLNHSENHCTPAGMALAVTIPSAEKDVKPSFVAGDNVEWHSLFVTQCGDFL